MASCAAVSVVRTMGRIRQMTSHKSVTSRSADNARRRGVAIGTCR